MSSIETPTTDNDELLSDYISKNSFIKHPDNPLTESEFKWQFKNRKTNGFSIAFIRVNSRKYLVHVPTYIRCLAEQRGA